LSFTHSHFHSKTLRARFFCFLHSRSSSIVVYLSASSQPLVPSTLAAMDVDACLALAAAAVKEIQQSRNEIDQLLRDSDSVLSHFPPTDESTSAGKDALLGVLASAASGSAMLHSESSVKVRPHRTVRHACMPLWLQKQAAATADLQAVEVINPTTKQWEVAELVRPIQPERSVSAKHFSETCCGDVMWRVIELLLECAMRACVCVYVCVCVCCFLSISVRFKTWTKKTYDVDTTKHADCVRPAGTLEREHQDDQLLHLFLHVDYRWTVYPCGTDGNCLYRSVSHQMYGHEDKHADLRRDCGKHISRHRKRFQEFITQDIESFLTQQKTDGEWGCQVCLVALSEMLLTTIHVYLYDHTLQKITVQHVDKPPPDNTAAIMKEPAINISFHGYGHYNSLARLPSCRPQ
jgi:hypothetical protein